MVWAVVVPNHVCWYRYYELGKGYRCALGGDCVEDQCPNTVSKVTQSRAIRTSPPRKPRPAPLPTER